MGILDRWRTPPAPPPRPARGKPPVALTAAAARVEKGDNDYLRRLQQGWQTRAFGYYRTIPEIWFASQFYAGPLSKLEIFVGQVDPDSGEVERVDDEEIQGYVERIQDPGGGRAGLLGAFGRLWFINGEGFMLVTENLATGEEKWEFLSVNELRPQGDGSFTRYRAPSLGAEEIRMSENDVWEPLGPECVVYRFWRRDPEYSELADAPMRAVLDLCDELMWLTQAVLARAKSRLSAGVFVIPEQAGFPLDQAIGEEDPEEDEFLSELNEHFIAAIQDPGSASAVAPYLLRIDANFADKVKLIEMQDPSKWYPETGLRMECIQRIAMGLDMPPEILLGKSDANHWTAWSIDEQTWKANLQPVAQGFCDDLTAAYLKPALRADGYAGDYVIAYDASAIINHPDRTQDAKDLHKEGVISDEALREAAGFDETDAITDEAERNRRLGVQLRDSSVALDGIPSVRSGGVEVSPGEIVTGQDGGAVETPAGSGGTGPPERPTGNAPPVQPRTAAAAVDPQNLAMLNGAVRLALTQCRDKAGSRIVSRCQGNDEARAMIRDVPKHQVAAALGMYRTRALVPGKTPRDLVAGGTETLAAMLLEWGVGLDIASRTCQAIEQHAARTLHEEKPGLPPELIEK